MKGDVAMLIAIILEMKKQSCALINCASCEVKGR